MSEKSSALRSLVTATSDLQEKLQNVVRCLEQEGKVYINLDLLNR